MLKKGNYYFPSENFKKNANLNDESVYLQAERDPVKFWASLAEKLFWFKKWEKDFVHNPPYFSWFLGGKINITTNIFERNIQGWEKIKNKKAIIFIPQREEEGTKYLSYEELFKRVNKLANALKSIGVKKGDRVIIYLPMIPEIIISLLACARIGAVHSVVFSAFSPQALRIRCQITQAKVMITADGYYYRNEMINLKSKADEAIKETNIEKVIVVKRLGNEINWQKDRDIWYHELEEKENDFCEAEIMDAEDILFILFTSGTTGVPKGCIHTCGGYTVQAYYTGKWIFDFKENDILWCTSDLGWITGHTYVCYSPLLSGISTLIFEGVPDFPHPDRWAKVIEENGVTIFYTAPTAIRLFQRYGDEIPERYDFKSLRLLGSVGEPIDEFSWYWYFEKVGKKRCPIVDTWWQTETGGILATSLPGIGPFLPTFTGRPLPGIRMKILDDQGNETPPLKPGNLVILPPFSPGMLRGLFNADERYEKTYWSTYGKEIYFTSDGALKNEDGLIRILGRTDDVIKVAGHRISTGELENVINKEDELIECAVVGLPDDLKGQVPVVFAVPKEEKIDENIIKDKIIKRINNEIGPIALPKKIFLVPDLPKTRSGKIMRRILRNLLTNEPTGDLSTLSNPESIEQIESIIKRS